MSDVVRDAIKGIRERLNEITANLDKIEGALKYVLPVAIEEVELTKEAIERLPWKAYEKGNGWWIFSNLKEPAAKKLREALLRNRGKMELHGCWYRFSGEDDFFISRYPRR